MAVPRRAFALMLVLVAVGATFALSMQGAVALRTAMAEAAVLRRDARLRRDATGAATIALAALTSGAHPRTDATGASGGPADTPSATPSLDDTGVPEMPQEMKEFMLGLLKDKKKPSDSPGAADSGGLVLTHTGGPYTALKKRGVPTVPLVVAVEDRSLRVTVSDAGGLLNINTADAPAVTRYFRAVGLDERASETIADEILDWRDEDSVPRSHGAERDAYLARGVTIRNGPFRSIDELLYLPAMTRELLASIREDLTLIGDGTINARSAPRPVLMSAPGMTDAAANRLLALRATGDMDERSLTDALGALASDAAGALRLTPTAFLRLRIEPVAGGPAFDADAVVDDTRGVRILNLRMISR